MAESRLLKEIEDLNQDPPENITAGPINEDDIYHWEATIDGPDDTDYNEGIFIVDIQIPKEYPFKPPICRFKTKIFHPNINQNTGEICINILDMDNWNPSLTISNILMSIMVLLYSPNFDSPLNDEAKKLYYQSDSHSEYKEMVRKWVMENSGKENITIE